MVFLSWGFILEFLPLRLLFWASRNPWNSWSFLFGVKKARGFRVGILQLQESILKKLVVEVSSQNNFTSVKARRNCGVDMAAPLHDKSIKL